MKMKQPPTEPNEGIFNLDNFKGSLKADVDFILKPKSIEDKTKILSLVLPRITSYSHQTFDEHSNPLFKHYVGHQVRKDFRRELTNYIKKYIEGEIKKCETKKDKLI